jgi:hypothetical protein
MGLTMHRRVYAFSQQYHDDYFIKVYTYTNTGNTDYDDDIELTAPLTGVRIGECPRYSTCREGATKYDNQQSWGKFSWVTKRGEDYIFYYNESITEANPIVDWLRVGLCWAGQSDRYSSWDNIGAPDLTGNGHYAPRNLRQWVYYMWISRPPITLMILNNPCCWDGMLQMPFWRFLTS